MLAFAFLLSFINWRPYVGTQQTVVGQSAWSGALPWVLKSIFRFAGARFKWSDHGSNVKEPCLMVFCGVLAMACLCKSWPPLSSFCPFCWPQICANCQTKLPFLRIRVNPVEAHTAHTKHWRKATAMEGKKPSNPFIFSCGLRFACGPRSAQLCPKGRARPTLRRSAPFSVGVAQKFRLRGAGGATTRVPGRHAGLPRGRDEAAAGEQQGTPHGGGAPGSASEVEQDGRPVEHLLLTTLPGTGKTHLARKIVARLREQSEAVHLVTARRRTWGWGRRRPTTGCAGTCAGAAAGRNWTWRSGRTWPAWAEHRREVPPAGRLPMAGGHGHELTPESSTS